MLLDTQFIVQLILSAENELDQNMNFFLKKSSSYGEGLVSLFNDGNPFKRRNVN